MMMMAFRAPDDVADPSAFTEVAGLEDYPPLGAPADLAERLNARLRALGLDSGALDDTSGVILPDGVGSISFTVGQGQVRFILVNGPTGDLIDVFRELRAQDGWHLLDAGTGEPL